MTKKERKMMENKIWLIGNLATAINATTNNVERSFDYGSLMSRIGRLTEEVLEQMKDA